LWIAKLRRMQFGRKSEKLEHQCIFHAKLDTYSTANWTPVPLQTGQFEAA
jgi:hypothetical protein